MKIIFLDVDGVLNNAETFKRTREMVVVDPACVHRLFAIIQQTGAKVVLSSTWRWSGEARSVLADAGVSWIDQTATSGDLDGGRNRRIERWLDENGAPDRFVILDDDDDVAGVLGGLFIQTDPAVGLSAQDASEAIRWLNA